MNDAEENEELLIGLLADYDEALAAEASTETIDSTAAELDPQTAAEWTALKHCVARLERMRRGAGLPNLPPLPVPPRDEEGVFDAPRPRDGEGVVKAPRRVGRFILERELGRGGLGIVYLAHDPRLGRKVALKIPRFEALVSDEARRRFLREAEAAARLNHPHLVSLYEVGEDRGICYLAMEYCPGPTLTQWLSARTGPVPCREAAEIVLELAEGVEHAHGRGVLHRDIKPSNVLLQDRGDAARDASRWSPKLTDFGMTKLLEQQRGDTTRSGAILGTLAYMAPEQIEGRVDRMDVRTDVYGLGTLLYELLIGAAPHGGETDLATLRNMIVNEPPPPRKLRRDVPRDLEAIALKCLAKNPESRYATASELKADLRRFLEGQPTAARPLSVAARAVKWVRRRPAVAALWLVTVFAAFTVFAINARRLEDVGHAQTLVERESQRADSESSLKRRLHYDSRMRTAQQAWRDGNLQLMRGILGEYGDGTPEAELRHFEWYHLNYLANLPHRVLRGHAGEVYAVAYSPDGKVVLSGGEDGTVRLWDAVSGAELAVLREHSSCVNDLKFSPDGDTFVTSSCDKTIKLWSLRERKVLATLTGHTQEVDWCVFIDEGRVLASLSRHTTAPREARLWDVASRTMRTDWPPAGEGFEGFVPGLTGGTLVTFSNGHAAIWKREKESWALAQRSDRLPPSSTAILSPDEDYLLASDWPRGDVRVLRLRDGLLVNSALGHTGPVNTLSISASGNRMATASNDSSVRVFDFPSGRPRHNFLGHEGRVWRVVWSPSGDSLASAGSDGTARIWDLAHGGLPLSLASVETSHGSHVEDFAFLEGGCHVNAIYGDGRSELWDVRTGRNVSFEQAAVARSHGDDPHPRRPGFTASSYRLLPRWDKQASAMPSSIFQSPGGEPAYFISCARLLANGSQLMEISAGKVRKWKLEPFQIVEERPLDSELNQSTKLLYDISHDAERVCRMSHDGRLQVCNLTNTSVADLDRVTGGVAARFSPDDRRILVVMAGQVREYDALSGARLREFPVQSGRAANYSGDGRRIAAASHLGFTLIYDAITGEETMRMECGCGELLFASDRRSLLMRDGELLYLWPGSRETEP